MTGNEYIALTKRLIPVKPGRHEELVRAVFSHLVNTKYFIKANNSIDLNIISSTSIFCEVVHTSPNITIIWDNYQWDILEHFIMSSLLYLNNQKEKAKQVFKLNVYGILSMRLTYIAPELSYLFATQYCRIQNEMPFDFALMISSTYTDLMYCQLLALGHELSHILFENSSHGKKIFNYKEKDFFNILHGAIRSGVAEKINVHGINAKELIKSIGSDSNKEYRKELICDALSFELLHTLIMQIDQGFTPVRSQEELFDDVLCMNDFVIRMLDTLSYLIEFWTQFGSRVSSNQDIKPEYLQIKASNYTIWKKQYYARETLVSLYLRVLLLRDNHLAVTTQNKKYIDLYNSNVEMIQEFMSLEDGWLLQIISELGKLLKLRIPAKELIAERDRILQL